MSENTQRFILQASKLIEANNSLLQSNSLGPSLWGDVPDLDITAGPELSQHLSILALANIILSVQNLQLKEDLNLATVQYRQLVQAQKDEGLISEHEAAARRIRRSKEALDRNHVCVVNSCGRRYSSESALNQHMRIKHVDFYEAIKRKAMKLN